MWKVLEIASYVVAPLAYGLAVELLFEWIRRRRGAPAADEPGVDG